MPSRHTLRTHFYRGVQSYGDGIDAGIVRGLLTRDDDTVAVAELPTAYLNHAQHRFRFAVVDGRVTHAVGRLADAHLARGLDVQATTLRSWTARDSSS